MKRHLALLLVVIMVVSVMSAAQVVTTKKVDAVSIKQRLTLSATPNPVYGGHSMKITARLRQVYGNGRSDPVYHVWVYFYYKHPVTKKLVFVGGSTTNRNGEVSIGKQCRCCAERYNWGYEYVAKSASFKTYNGATPESQTVPGTTSNTLRVTCISGVD
jgi:hypothetical protein